MIAEAIVNLLSGGGLGAVIGSVGGIAEKVISKKMDYAHKQAEWEHIHKMHSLQAQSDQQKHRNELIIAQENNATSTLKSSIEHDTSISSVHKWVNDVRALFRPLITGTLVVLTLFSPEVFINLTTMAVSWWFGSRSYHKQ